MRPFFRYLLLAVWAIAWWTAGASAQRWAVESASGFAGAALEGLEANAEGALVLQAMDPGRNLAFGQAAEDEFGRFMPFTDGEVTLGVSEWVSGTPNVFGRFFILDLGRDRAINRLRLLAGGTALNQREYFVRGYRLEAATQRDPAIWRLLAENAENFRLDVDTGADGTWKVLDPAGQPEPRVGRFVRLTLIRQDRSNWVSIGEVEVFGGGLVEEGTAVGVFEAGTPVNVGRLRWSAETPAATEVEMAFRPVPQVDWPEPWGFDVVQAGDGALFAGEEPVDFLQYRARLLSDDPFATPALATIEVEYDPVLVASRVTMVVEPDTARKGRRSRLSLRARVEAGPADYGVDLLQVEGVPFEVEEVRVDGRSLVRDEGLASGFRWQLVAAEGRSRIELAASERIESTAEVEIVGSAVFVIDRTPLSLQVGSLEQSTRDGYTNWQNAAAEGAAAVRAFGAPPDLLSQVEVGPSPYSPFEGGTLDFKFVVSNLREQARVTVDIFTLDGRRLRRLREDGLARAYSLAWDGRGGGGRIVEPGLYIYEIRIEAGAGSSARRGTTVVAY